MEYLKNLVIVGLEFAKLIRRAHMVKPLLFLMLALNLAILMLNHWAYPMKRSINTIEYGESNVKKISVRMMKIISMLMITKILRWGISFRGVSTIYWIGLIFLKRETNS